MKKLTQIFVWIILPTLCICCIKKTEIFDGVNGYKTTHYPNGKVHTRKEYKEGMLNGQFVEYYENGEVESEIFYKDNYKDGPFKSYYENGKLKSHLFFKQGKKDSICTQFFKDGRLKREENYKAGDLDGPTKTYFDNGQIASELFYKNDKKHGLQKYFYESGQLKALTDFYNGRPGIRLEEYTPEGKRIKHDLSILVKEVDKLAFESEYIYMFKLNNSSSDDNFYMGELEQGKYFPVSYYTLKQKDNFFIKDFYVPKYAFLMDKLNFIAVTKTKFGNDLILTKRINVAINHY